MNVTHQLQQIGIFLTDNGFVAILEKMAAPMVFQIVPNGMTRQ
jgi:hypothetical protein